MLSKYVSTDFGTTITGMQDVTYIDGSGDLQNDVIVIADGSLFNIQGSTVTTTISYLAIDGDTVQIDGDNVIWASTVASVNPIGNTDGYQMVESNGKVIIAGSTAQRYDPISGAINTLLNAPTSQPGIATYQGRLVLFGENHILHMSRMGDFEDWDYGDREDQVNRAVALFAGDDNRIGLTVNCGMNYEDTAFVIGTNDDMWVIYGNPRDPGNVRVENVSHHVGVIAPGAATIAPNGLVVFIARDGLYTWQIGSKSDPEPFSPVVIPEDFKDINVSTNDIMMEYDHKSRGIHIFITPSSDAGEHWWLDLKEKALWPVVFPNNDHQPLASCRISQSGDSDILIAGKDGYIREFSNSATSDDGTAVVSHLLIGPLHQSGEYDRNALLKKLLINLADSSGTVTWRTVVADNAEEAVDNAETDINAGTTTNVDQSGTVTAGYNYPEYPRSRGAFLVLWLTSSARWSWGNISMVQERLGRLR